MSWTKYDTDDKGKYPTPPPGELVLIYSLDDEVELGYWDSGWWCTWYGSDDVFVIAWKKLEYALSTPEFADEWAQELRGRWEDE
jgi:hypothetical protein